jgi:hypothetical protein
MSGFCETEGRPVADKSFDVAQSTNGNSSGGSNVASSGSWDIDRLKDGSLLVRMHSVDRQGRPLPDAVFTFRKGEPQYEHWERQAKKSANKTKSP